MKSELYTALLIYSQFQNPVNPPILPLGWPIKRKGVGLSHRSTVFISRIGRGVESPSVDNLVKIAKALGVRVRDLVDGF
ncbi:MAG: helix-turn-helix transcriptional regulator [Verrucomicrobiota bacterium]|jgi:hypothetical protein